VNLIRPEFFAVERTRVQAAIRYRTSPENAWAVLRGDALELRFDRPVRAVAPGQLAALFAGDEVLGAATIESALYSNA